METPGIKDIIFCTTGFKRVRRTLRVHFIQNMEEEDLTPNLASDEA